MRLQNFEDRFIYVVKYLDKDISRYLTSRKKQLIFIIQLKKKALV